MGENLADRGDDLRSIATRAALDVAIEHTLQKARPTHALQCAVRLAEPGRINNANDCCAARIPSRQRSSLGRHRTACSSPQPAIALRTTTSQGGVFQNTNRANAASPSAKSGVPLTALVHTG